MEVRCGEPTDGVLLEQYQTLALAQGLRWEVPSERMAAVLDDGRLVAAGALEGNILKCLAVDSARQGEGLSATLVSALTQEAFRLGRRHLFLYTKPENAALFTPLLFQPVAQTREVLLMENTRGGLSQYLCAVRRDGDFAAVGAAVVNCDPFTLGHLHLLRTAASQCEHLYVFVLSEDTGMFAPELRLELVRRGCEEIKNLSVHSSGGYLVSRATFPTYFLKENADAGAVQCELDIALFLSRFVPALGITHRFVGTEPFCPVTAAYHARLKQALPPRGVTLTELERLRVGGKPVSASAVRRLLRSSQLADTRPLLPDSTFRYLCEHPF